MIRACLLVSLLLAGFLISGRIAIVKYRKNSAPGADGSMKSGCVLLLLSLLLLGIPVSADHNVTFVNTCDQTVWINLQGGPKGVCNGVIDNNTHVLKTCSACSLCPANENTTAQLCNTSAATGTTDALCCPGIIQEQLYCWDKTQCGGGYTPPQCCPPPQDNSTAGQSYNCPSAGETTGCGNTTMTQSQIDALSGYNNPKNGLSHVHCNGTLISGGGFELPANNGARSFMFNTGWQGAFYPRTNCSFDASGIGGCETGNCTDGTGKGRLLCGGAGSAAPVTKGEMNLDDTDDWYDVSWVDGFNIAMIIRPTEYDAGYQATDPTHHCASAGCNVGLSDFASTAVPSWDILKYPGPAHFAGILSDCNYYSSLPRDSTFSNDLWYGYCCPISEGYVNDSSFTASCAQDVPAGKTCKTCAGLNNTLFPFNQQNALPNSARLFFDTCPNAYAYTYNDTSALMTCRGNSRITTNYTVTFSCPAPVPVPALTPQPLPVLGLESPSGHGSEPVSAAQISPGGAAGTLMNFIFNDYHPDTGSSTTSDATIHHIHITLTETLGETILRLENHPDLGTVPELSGHAFTLYYRIESPHLQPAHVNSSLVEFSVKENFLASLGLKPEDIVLMHWDGTRWTELPTRSDYSSNGRVYFSATTPGFRYFVITHRVMPQAVHPGTTLPVSVLTSVNTPPHITGAAAAVPRDTLPAEPRDSRAGQKNQSTVTPPADSAPGIPAGAIGVILLAGVAIGSVWYARRWWIRRQNPALFKRRN